MSVSKPVSNVVSRRLPTRLATLTTCLFALVGLRPAKAQLASSSQASPQATAPSPAERPDKVPTTEVSLGLFGQLTPTRIPTTSNTYTLISTGQTFTNTSQTTQGTSASAGVEATFHQQFRRFIGYNVNLGYSRFDENYSVAGGSTFNNGGGYLVRQSVGTNMYELGATAVLEGPRTRRFSTSAETGGAVLAFLPTLRPSPPSVQIRPALAFGVGLNYKVADHLSMRFAYRGLFYKNPDFKNPGYIPNDIKLFTVTSEPTLSLVYTFGKHGKEKSSALKH